MDNTENAPTVLSLCTGYGGIEIGLERVLGRIRVLAHVEIEAFAIANLVDKMETGRLVPAPVWTDIKTLDARIFRGLVDILTGGYPCQPFSAAGKRLGTDDPRHLWPHIKRVVRECEPRWCFFENVEGHVSLGLSTVISDLEEMGYTATWGIFSAAEVGAPHQRKRVFILAESSNTRSGGNSGQAECKTGAEILRQGDGEERPIRSNSTGSDKELANSGRRRSKQPWAQQSEKPHLDDKEWVGGANTSNQGFQKCWGSGQLSDTGGCNQWPARPGCEQYEWEAPRVMADPGGYEWWENEQRGREEKRATTGGPGGDRQTKPGLGRTVNGAANRVDRLRLLGNGVVPQTAERAFRVLMSRPPLRL